MKKQYYVMHNVGNAKYCLNRFNGTSTHKDGSPFFDIEIFRNKKKLAKRIKEIRAEGYAERHGW